MTGSINAGFSGSNVRHDIKKWKFKYEEERSLLLKELYRPHDKDLQMNIVNSKIEVYAKYRTKIPAIGKLLVKMTA